MKIIKRILQILLLIMFYLQLIFGVIYQSIKHFHLVIKNPLSPAQLLAIAPSLFWLWLIIFLYSKIKPRSKSKPFRQINEFSEGEKMTSISVGVGLLIMGVMGYFLFGQK